MSKSFFFFVKNESKENMPSMSTPSKRPLQEYVPASLRRVSHVVPAPVFLSDEDCHGGGLNEASTHGGQTWSPDGVEGPCIGIKPDLLLILPTSPPEEVRLPIKHHIRAASGAFEVLNGASLLWAPSTKQNESAAQAL